MESEAGELRNLTNRVEVLPDNIMSKQLWLLVVQSSVIMAAFLTIYLWLCRINRNLEQKLNTIQTTLSSQNPLIPSQLTSTGVATESTTSNQQKAPSAEQHSEQSCQPDRTKLSNCSQSSIHTRSLSVSDLRRQAENIGDLSRADLKCLTTNRSKSWQENGVSSGQSCCERERAAALSGGPLVSHSLSSLDDRRSTAEVSRSQYCELVIMIQSCVILALC